MTDTTRSPVPSPDYVPGADPELDVLVAHYGCADNPSGLLYAILKAEGLWPDTIDEYLDKGGALADVPDIENYARVVTEAWSLHSDRRREDLAETMLERATRLVNGEPIETPDGDLVGVAIETPEGQDTLRYHMWMAQALSEKRIADRFTAALPAEVRTSLARRENR